MRTRGKLHCNFAELAKRDGFSQADILAIAKASSKQQVSRWFNNQDAPHALYLLRIKLATGWKLEEMLKEREDSPMIDWCEHGKMLVCEECAKRMKEREK